MIENVVSQDLNPILTRSPVLTTQLLKKNTLATWLIIELLVASFERNFNIFCAIRIIPLFLRSISDARPNL